VVGCFCPDRSFLLTASRICFCSVVVYPDTSGFIPDEKMLPIKGNVTKKGKDINKNPSVNAGAAMQQEAGVFLNDVNLILKLFITM